MSRVLLRRSALVNGRNEVVAYHLVHTGAATAMPDLLAATSLATVARGLPLLLEIATSDLDRVLSLLDDVDAWLMPADDDLDDADVERWSSLPQGVALVVRDALTSPSHDPLVEHARHVLIDATRLDVTEITQRWRRRGSTPPIVIGVHRADLASRVRALGDVLLSGRFLSDVERDDGVVVEGDRLTLLRLVSMLQSDVPAPREVADVVRQSPSLSYELLRWVNSAAVGLSRSVEDLSVAVSLLGPGRIRQVVSLMLTRELSNRPPELSRSALLRARMCEQLGSAMNDPRPGYYVVGLFSMLDALLEVPLDRLVAQLPLSDEIVSALLHHEGHYGRVLQMCKLYEHSQFDEPELAIVAPEVLSAAYLDAMVYADGVLSAVAVAA